MWAMVLRRDGGAGMSLFGAEVFADWLARVLRPAEPRPAPLAERLERIVLGGARRYTRVEVEERSGVTGERSHGLWRALGFADVDDGDIVFTDSDVDALKLLDDLVGSGIIDAAAEAAVARAAGQSLSRLAEWEIGLLVDYISARSERGPEDADEAVVLRVTETILPMIEQLHSYIWRRHIAALAGPSLAGSAEELVSKSLVVGFADMVDYTRLTRDLAETKLTGLIERFESMTAAVVASAGGRVVKMLGDEVLFAADQAATAATIGLGLLDGVTRDPGLPDLRIGMAAGNVLSRFGDVYGPVVNIASRLTTAAKPGTVLVDRQLSIALAGEPDVRLRRRRPISARGYARLSAWRLTRAAPEPSSPP
jgi:adenylate cyclase